ncbi:hypothetical protein [Salinigranum marinum]|uniref:hypothetical protein n=1 Tax=Salinigranum marinum TaxID=1515595 RepID=UPI002989A2FF|nr:hypothetical protein [Salinigranum marinum]
MNRRALIEIFVVVVVLGSTAAMPFASAHETPPPYPQFEPNDDFDRATKITPRTLHGLEAIKYTNATHRPAIVPPPAWEIWHDDEDVYAVDLERGEPLPVTLYHYGNDGNLQYEIYDPSKSEVASVDPDGNWQQTGSALGRSEKAIQKGNSTVLARCSGTHYIKVKNEESTRASYRLEVDDRFEHNDELTSAATLTEGTYDDLMITTYDEDFYRLDVDKGETIEATIRLTTQAHWEGTLPPERVTYGSSVTYEEWAPYDHPRWETPSFHFEARSGVSGGGDFRSRPVNQVENDQIHQDTVSLEITESGTIFLIVRADSWWTSAIDGAPKWKANSARYDLTITRSGSPTEPDQPDHDSDDTSTDSVEEAFDRLEVDAQTTDVGFATSQLGGEIVNLHVRGRGTYSFELDENLDIEDFSGCGRDDATLEVETDDDTVHRIGSSERPSRELRTAFNGDDIRVRGVGPVKRLKWGAITVAKDLLDELPFS